MARKARCVLEYCKIQPDAVGHLGNLGILHLTNYALVHTKWSWVYNKILKLRYWNVDCVSVQIARTIPLEPL